jgi:hypothetical protein
MKKIRTYINVRSGFDVEVEFQMRRPNLLLACISYLLLLHATGFRMFCKKSLKFRKDRLFESPSAIKLQETVDIISEAIPLSLDPIINNQNTSINEADEKRYNLVKDNIFPRQNYANDDIMDIVVLFLSTLQSVLNKESEVYALEELLENNGSWLNPFISSIAEAREGLQKFANFFSETSIVLFEHRILSPDTVEIIYQLSFWYPLPWRPRIIIPATAVLKLSPRTTLTPSPILSSSSTNSHSIPTTPTLARKITSVTERWEVSPFDIFVKQMPPRLWDLWHALASPIPEYPPIKEVAKAGNVRMLELPHSICVEVHWSGAAKVRMSPFPLENKSCCISYSRL